jgi:hypothetical protein
MTDFPHDARRLTALDRWVLAIATALIVLIVAGVLPRLVLVGG